MEQLADVQPTDGHAPTLSLRIIAVDADLVRLAGDGNAALVLRQLLFWWRVLGRRPFYKFNQPAPQHRAYRPGDSWLEETGLTRSQFKTARKRFAVKVQGKDPQQIQEAFAKGVLAVYWTTEDHLTWYVLNEVRLRTCAPALCERLLDGKEQVTDSALGQRAQAPEFPDHGQTGLGGAPVNPLLSVQQPVTTHSWTKSNKAVARLSASPAKQVRRSSSIERVPSASALETSLPDASLEDTRTEAAREVEGASIRDEGSATERNPECSPPASPDAASLHQEMQESRIGITEITAESVLQREQSETNFQRSTSLPPTARARANQEEEGEQEGWSQAEQAKIQAALEVREVFAHPARQIAERAVQEGLGVEAVAELFEVQMQEAARTQARNPLTAAVWRLQHQPLRLSGRARTRAETVRALLAAPSTEAGETEWCGEAEDMTQEGAVPPEEVGEEEQGWQAILDDLRLQMTRATFEQWLRDTRLESVEDGMWVISTPNPYAPEVLTHRLGRLIRQTLARNVGEGVEVRFEVVGGNHG